MTRPRLYCVVAAGCLCAAMALHIVPPAHAQTGPSAALDNPVAALSLDQLSATRDRPLFTPSRRAPQPLIVSSVRPPAPPPPPTPPPKIELQGTILNADDSLAVVVSSADNQTMRLRLGDEVGGWKVIVIDQRKLVLAHDERVAEFTMFADKNAANAPNAANTAPAEQQPPPPPDQKTVLPPRPRASLGPGGVQQQ